MSVEGRFSNKVAYLTGRASFKALRTCPRYLLGDCFHIGCLICVTGSLVFVFVAHIFGYTSALSPASSVFVVSCSVPIMIVPGDSFMRIDFPSWSVGYTIVLADHVIESITAGAILEPHSEQALSTWALLTRRLC